MPFIFPNKKQPLYYTNNKAIAYDHGFTKLILMDLGNPQDWLTVSLIVFNVIRSIDIIVRANKKTIK